MIAKLQQIVACTLALLTLGWAAAFGLAGHPGWAVAGVGVIAGAYAIALGTEFLFLACVHRDDPTPRAHAASLCRAWIGELLIAPPIFCWRQPFRSAAEPDFLPALRAGRRGVVLVHGMFCNRGFWNPWMTKLRSRNVPFVAVTLEPPFASIDTYVQAVESAVCQIEKATGLSPVLIGHSMGGLALRRWFSQQPDPLRVARLLTIGTPHHGTWLARFGQAPNAVQMRMQSPWLTQLGDRECRPAAYARFTCFYSTCDNVVFPASNAMLVGAANREVKAAAHIQMAFVDQVFDEACHWLEASAANDSPSP